MSFTCRTVLLGVIEPASDEPMSKREEEERRMVSLRERLWLPEETSPVMIILVDLVFEIFFDRNVKAIDDCIVDSELITTIKYWGGSADSHTQRR
mmetsp:Transcript_27928/g.67291  ORF Transcript_27928/g.67291 Transcript_27928/m.67291 type:complete len:95 (-) Transcript_27928:65-349(-)